MANWEVVLEGRQGGQDMLNVLHYQDNTAGVVDWTAVATTFYVDLTDQMIPMCTAEVRWTGITYREDILGSIGVFVPFPLGDVIGTYPGGDLMRQAAMLVRKRTTATTHPNLGWIFQGGLCTVGLTAAGRWETAFLTDVQSFWDDMRLINTGVGDVLTMVIKARNPLAPNTVPYNAVTSVQAVSVPRTVATRREGVGS